MTSHLHTVEIRWSRTSGMGDGINVCAAVQNRNPSRYFYASRNITSTEPVTEDELRMAEYRCMQEAITNYMLWCQEGQPTIPAEEGMP